MPMAMNCRTDKRNRHGRGIVSYAGVCYLGGAYVTGGAILCILKMILKWSEHRVHISSQLVI